MKLDLSDISKIVVATAKSSTPTSSDTSDTTDPSVGPAKKYSYVILDVSELQVEDIADQILVEQGTFLKAVLALEFYDDNFEMGHLRNAMPPECDSMSNIANLIDTWYAERSTKIQEIFEFLTDMRPSKISDLIVTHGSALIEICTDLVEVPEDFGAIDVSDIEEAIMEAEKGPVEEDEGEE